MRIIAAMLLLPIAIGAAAAADLTSNTTVGYQGLRSVAVISVLGHIPMRVDGFAWRRANLNVPGDWAIDDFVTTRIANALRNRFVVARVGAKPGVAADFAANPPAWPFEWLQRHVRADPLVPNVDAYILAYPITVHAGDATWNGLALTHKGSLFGTATTLASAAYAIAIYDARTGQKIGDGEAQTWDPAAVFPVAIETCANGIWASRPGDLTNEQRLQINDEFRALIAKSLPAALDNAHLVAGWRRRLQTDTWDGRPLACRPQ